VTLCRAAILASIDDSIVDYVGKRMVEGGLYAPSSVSNKHDMRYRITRMIFNLERGSFGPTQLGQFHFWCIRNGFGPTTFKRKQAIAS
jgi:hypothetical protein